MEKRVVRFVTVPDTPHIGTLREKPLHASLKNWYAQPGDDIEVAVDGYVVDLVRDELLVEIQTSSFSKMKKKLGHLLDSGRRVRVVHSIPIDKWIVKIGDAGEILSRKRSPKHGQVTDVFSELVSFPELMSESGLEIDVLLTLEEEFRRHSPGQAWRRKGWIVEERRLLEVVETTLLIDERDLAALLPDGLPEPFTTTDLADGLGRPLRAGQQMAYCLRKAGVIEAIGKQGQSIAYGRA